MSEGTWATSEAKNMTLKDRRRNSRVAKILEAIDNSPASSIPHAFEGINSQIKGAYRFVSTTEIDEQDILEGHYKTTEQRIGRSDGKVIIVSDGMDASFSNLKKTTGLGTLSNSKKSLGIKLQNTFAFSESCIPLGMLFQEYWVRDLATFGKKKNRSKLETKEKESYHWIEAIKQIKIAVFF